MPATQQNLPAIGLKISGNAVEHACVVVIAGQPCGTAMEGGKTVTENAVGLFGGVLGEVAGGQDQVRLAMGLQHLIDHGREAVPSVDTQQGTVLTGHQVGVCYLEYPQGAGLVRSGHGEPVKPAATT